MAHRFSDEIMLALTGKLGIFNTKIAYTGPAGKNNKAVYVMDVDGEGNYKVTRDSSINLGPSWSPDGGQLTSLPIKRAIRRYTLVTLGSGSVRQITHNGNTNITPAFSADGSQIYYASSLGSATEIGLERQGRKGKADNQQRRHKHRALRTGHDDIFVDRSRQAPRVQNVPRKRAWGEAHVRGLPQRFSRPFTGRDKGGLLRAGLWSVRYLHNEQRRDEHKGLTIASGSNEHPRWSPDAT